MSDYYSLEPIITDPTRKPAFYVTWESTLKCNLDCSYCGAHDNELPHSSLEDCKKTIDFLIPYIDLYMSKRISDQRHVSMNIFGGESLIHPRIVDILEYFEKKYEPYKDKWTLDLNTVTNAVIKEKIWDRVVDKFNYWTVSYHTESTLEQQTLMRRNILDLKRRNKNFKVSVLMHTEHWDNAVSMIEWCKENDIPFLPRQIDHPWNHFQYWYTSDQAQWLRNFHSTGKISKTSCGTECGQTSSPTIGQKINFVKKSVINLVNMNSEGRQCCGGIPLHVDQDYTKTQTHVNNKFKGWTCGVNYFFVFVKQSTKEIFVNKDCKMDFNGNVAPIGNLDSYQQLLDTTRLQLEKDEPYAITCAKKTCLCGICSPKASTREKFNEIIKKYVE
jgi:pyruvate-formate lyase-activating enzyme